MNQRNTCGQPGFLNSFKHKIPIEFPNDDSFNDMQLITRNVMHLWLETFIENTLQNANVGNREISVFEFNFI